MPAWRREFVVATDFLRGGNRHRNIIPLSRVRIFRAASSR
jgi:hypothetical protein